MHLYSCETQISDTQIYICHLELNVSSKEVFPCSVMFNSSLILCIFSLLFLWYHSEEPAKQPSKKDRLSAQRSVCVHVASSLFKMTPKIKIK